MIIKTKNRSRNKVIFQIPTQVTNIEPIYTFNFHFDSQEGNQNVSSFEVQLNPKLSKTNRKEKKSAFYFDEKGNCQFCQIDENGYFIKGDIRLLKFNEHFSSELYGDKNLFFSITYGNTKDQVHFIKGKFNLDQSINN